MFTVHTTQRNLRLASFLNYFVVSYLIMLLVKQILQIKKSYSSSICSVFILQGQVRAY